MVSFRVVPEIAPFPVPESQTCTVPTTVCSTACLRMLFAMTEIYLPRSGKIGSRASEKWESLDPVSMPSASCHGFETFLRATSACSARRGLA